MTDITPLINSLLATHNVHTRKHPRKVLDTTDEFLKEAYRINTHIVSLHRYLHSIRPSYLSTAVPSHRRGVSRTGASAIEPQTGRAWNDSKRLTNTQREQIDAESKSTLRELNAGIRQLEDAEQLRKNTQEHVVERQRARKGFKVLGKWAAGGVAGPVKSPEEILEDAVQKTVNLHRETVIWYLRHKLDEAAELQRGMMETRLEREIEKSKSVLYKTKGFEKLPTETLNSINGQSNGPSGSTQISNSSALPMGDKERREIEQLLTPEQLQIFAQENNELLKHYEDTLDQVRTAERSMLEISELQTTLADNLELQSTRIDQLVEDAVNTEENVAGGNTQLKRATERWRPAKFVFYFSCGLSAFLIAWDLII